MDVSGLYNGLGEALRGGVVQRPRCRSSSARRVAS